MTRLLLATAFLVIFVAAAFYGVNLIVSGDDSWGFIVFVVDILFAAVAYEVTEKS